MLYTKTKCGNNFGHLCLSWTLKDLINPKSVRLNRSFLEHCLADYRGVVWDFLIPYNLHTSVIIKDSKFLP